MSWGSKGTKVCEGCLSSCSVRWEGGALISDHAVLMELAGGTKAAHLTSLCYSWSSLISCVSYCAYVLH